MVKYGVIWYSGFYRVNQHGENRGNKGASRPQGPSGLILRRTATNTLQALGYLKKRNNGTRLSIIKISPPSLWKLILKNPGDEHRDNANGDQGGDNADTDENGDDADGDEDGDDADGDEGAGGHEGVETSFGRPACFCVLSSSLMAEMRG